ncbi:MAG TPA: hypothetical protein VEI97_18065 [bacterium]|nr:hypothetical protein [bacterium]
MSLYVPKKRGRPRKGEVRMWEPPPSLSNNIFCPDLSEEDDAKITAFYKAEPKAFIERFLKIRTKDSEQIRPFLMNTGQQIVYRKIQELRAAKKPIRLVILKCRQLGISTLTEALLFWRARFFRNTNALVVSHEKVSAEAIFEMTKLFYDACPEEIRPQRSRNARGLLRMENPDVNSRPDYPGLSSQIQIATARNVDVGASQTLHAVHASEFARWPHPYETFLSIMQTVPNEPDTFVIVESTARGADDAFHRLWQVATSKSEDNQWIPIFLPFWIEPSYEMDLPCSDEEFLNTLDEYEKDLLREYPPINLRKIQWRRYKIATDCNNSIVDFNREAAPTAAECFAAHGETVFDLDSVHFYMTKTAREGRRGWLRSNGGRNQRTGMPAGKVFFDPDPDGPLTIWRHPVRGEDYVVGIDAAMGTQDDEFERGVISLRDEQDYSAAIVLSSHREQVAEFRSNTVEPYDYAEMLYLLGQYYNYAMLFPEVGNQGSGYAVQYRLKDLGYTRFGMWQRWDHRLKKSTQFIGFEPTAKTLPIMMSVMMKEVRRGADQIPREFLKADAHLPKLVLRSRQLLAEMTTYTINHGNMVGATKGSHDDLVRALGIALLGLDQIPKPRDVEEFGRIAKPDSWYNEGNQRSFSPEGDETPGWMMT